MGVFPMLKLRDILKFVGNALKVDYIVEEGTAGIWTYRKWNSGIAECWGTYNFGPLSITSPWGGLRVTDVNSILIQHPFTFKEVLFSEARATGNNIVIFGSIHVWSATTTTYCTLVSFDAMTNITGTIAVHVKGRWK
nr:MAG TPA: hypothetical protein [Caudoviricetes sp.]